MSDTAGFSTAAEEALQRAKAIAARLHQESSGTTPTASATTSTTMATTSTGKRRRWGVAPDEPTPTPSTSTTTTTQEEKDNAAKASAAASSNKRLKSADSGGKRMWITTTATRPAAHYVNFMKDELEAMPRQILGHEPDEQNSLSVTLQGRGAKGEPQASLGSGQSILTMGAPMEPLHVLLEASSQELLSRAEHLVEALLQRAEEAPVHPDLLLNVEEENQGSSSNNSHASQGEGGEGGEAAGDVSGVIARKSIVSTSAALATIQDPSSLTMRSSTHAYRPASVAHLIGQVNNPDGGGGAGGPGGAAGGGSGEFVEEIIPVPVGVVGFIIGKGGENIASLQNRTGAKVQVQRELPPGSSAGGGADSSTSSTPTHRNISVSAATPQALEHCKQLIQAVVQEKSRLLTGGGVGGSSSASSGGAGGSLMMNMNRKDALRLEEALAQGHAHFKVPIPDEDVGLVIGKGGATIRSLQDRTGANIQVPSASESQNGKRTVHITHPNAQGAQQAQQLIEELLQTHAHASSGANKNIPLGQNAGGTNPGAPTGEPEVTATMLIPDADVGLIIGRQGVVIRYLQDSTRTKIQIPTECIPSSHAGAPPERLATITGSAQACIQAQDKVGQIIADQSSAGVMAQASPSACGGAGAGSYGNYYFQPHHHLATGGGAPYNYSNPNAGRKPAAPTTPSEGQEGYSAEWAAYHAAQQAAATTAPPPQVTSNNNAYNYPHHPPHAGYAGYPFPHHYPQQQQQPWGAVAAPAPGTTGTRVAAAPGAVADPVATHAITTPTAAAAAPAGTTNPTGVVPPPPPAPVQDAYYEQFFRYTYYYGEAAARQYYGQHWSPPIGTVNPYGANPNGVQKAPNSAAAAATTGGASTATFTPDSANAAQPQSQPGRSNPVSTAVATADATTALTTKPSDSEGAVTKQDVLSTAAAPTAPTTAATPEQRETSVRKVSNLPAWMSKN